ncbi:MAG TPA: signal peptidase I, partial [Microthrixaceae bacterium]|nr:signal peptidase I [Microthrixaceae bacterium]
MTTREPNVEPAYDPPLGPPDGALGSSRVPVGPSGLAPDGVVGDVPDESRTFRVSEPHHASAWRTVASWGLTIAIAVVATLCVRAWVFEQYSIPSTSMFPTLEVGDRVIVSKLNRTPGRGDIVVFDRPSNDPAQSPDDPKVLIKRVIGLSGETVESRDGEVFVDGKALDESYLPEGTVTAIDEPIEVP